MLVRVIWNTHIYETHYEQKTVEENKQITNLVKSYLGHIQIKICELKLEKHVWIHPNVTVMEKPYVNPYKVESYVAMCHMEYSYVWIQLDDGIINKGLCSRINNALLHLE